MTQDLDSLLPAIYEDLKRLARVQRSRVYSKHSLGTRSIVHEAYLNLVKNNTEVANEKELFYLTSVAMRNIIIDNARIWSAKKRGEFSQELSLEQVDLVSASRSQEILALEEALVGLEQDNKRLADTVTCRFFGGLTMAETAEVMGLSLATAKRDWTLAKTLLFQRLST
ncbi:ECF-type sigma factor [Marinicella meishanensis]|uniref:ECF-type sigma factor n=1 Tax=Marinicella meishanensis TaxID=2873263 RepID=UPI001CC017FA|nr:ECF-type sigma factor [Marinicella sp. NBU2979]